MTWSEKEKGYHNVSGLLPRVVPGHAICGLNPELQGHGFWKEMFLFNLFY